MHKSIIALGIESSCDDTSIGVIKVAHKDNILVSEKLGLVTPVSYTHLTLPTKRIV